ncbi:peptidase S51 dipeptidase E [Virgibacillus indicus]|uniref:Peptidase S51 dipeptidase E n=1 Tax=Virgibacillus indicus TaxID=2024554 RepID=A0A265NCT4_9BACI|nr:Type 1 glutamine amidotransferase-like domain-containing protein [Virgibacillus indicus]OZU89617.1 peptidase S51 dipeptidase E [Virgibacillus indicus]
MMNRHLFLFGGSPPFNEELGRRFAGYALKGNSKAAILYINRDGWKQYMPKYTSVLEENGLTQFVHIPLSANPKGNLLQELSSCTGVIICGGQTERYRDYIVDTVLGVKIKKMYQTGIPIAGFSAGALICPEHCVISPKDNSRNQLLFLAGLGLIRDCVISVHYSKWKERLNVKRAMERVNASLGYGIDDKGSLYFKNERLVESESGGFHRLELT